MSDGQVRARLIYLSYKVGELVASVTEIGGHRIRFVLPFEYIYHSRPARRDKKAMDHPDDVGTPK